MPELLRVHKATRRECRALEEDSKKFGTQFVVACARKKTASALRGTYEPPARLCVPGGDRADCGFVRGAVLMFSSLSFFAALKVLPLADATGLNYLTPVLVTVMAGWFLREQITWTRWMFVVVGFGGMLLILQPGSGMLQAASFFALGAAALNATFQILTRKLAGDDLIALISTRALSGRFRCRSPFPSSAASSPI